MVIAVSMPRNIHISLFFLLLLCLQQLIWNAEASSILSDTPAQALSVPFSSGEWPEEGADPGSEGVEEVFMPDEWLCSEEQFFIPQTIFLRIHADQTGQRRAMDVQSPPPDAV